MKTVWRWLVLAAGALLALLGLSAWRRREAEAAGGRKAQQETERQKAKQLAADLEVLRQRQAKRLEAAVKREAAEAEARRQADAAAATPLESTYTAEEVLEAVRRQRKDVQ